MSALIFGSAKALNALLADVTAEFEELKSEFAKAGVGAQEFADLEKNAINLDWLGEYGTPQQRQLVIAYRALQNRRDGLVARSAGRRHQHHALVEAGDEVSA